MIPILKPIIKKEEEKAVLQVLKSGQLTQGPKTKQLEKKFSQWCQAKYALTTNSGTSALHLALKAVGIKPGDEIIVPCFGFIATINSILMVQAKPVFADIDEKIFNLDPEKITPLITKKTKAILTVNLFGQPANYEKINKIARKNNLLVIEDAAQSVNAEFNQKKSGSLANISCFSLYATKNITTGEGGLITTNNKKYFVKAESLRSFFSCRLTDIQAVIALIQIKRLNQITKKRQQIAEKYNQAFKNIKGLIIPFCQKNVSHVYHQYTLKITKKFKLSRDKLSRYLLKKGIDNRIYYSKPLHLQPGLRYLGYKKGNFPIAEKISQQVLSIPIHPLLKEKEINYIIKTILKI